MKHQITSACILIYLSTLIFLGLRGYLLEDTRFGWGMFRHQVDYRIEYSWEMESGEEVLHESGEELKRGVPRKVSSGKRHRTRYGIGAVRIWTYSYMEYLWNEKRPEGAKSLEAKINYRVNRGNEQITETYRIPTRRSADERE